MYNMYNRLYTSAVPEMPRFIPTGEELYIALTDPTVIAAFHALAEAKTAGANKDEMRVARQVADSVLDAALRAARAQIG